MQLQCMGTGAPKPYKAHKNTLGVSKKWPTYAVLSHLNENLKIELTAIPVLRKRSNNIQLIN